VENFFRLAAMTETLLSLFLEARQLHSTHPRAVPSRGVGRVCAVQAKTIYAQEVNIAELERSKAWLDEQRARWRQLAEEHEQMLREQKAWTEELEKGKAWLEEQWVNWRKIAEERGRIIREQERVIREWQESRWGRISIRLGALREPAEIRRKLAQEKY
jgi:hypothetical protein